MAARRRFLPPGPLREAAERRLWARARDRGPLPAQTGAGGGELGLRFGGVQTTSIHSRLLKHVLIKARMSGLGDVLLDPSITVHDPDIGG